MSNQIHTSAPDPGDGGEGPQQAAWLDLARRQAGAAAEIRIQQLEPFQWDRLEQKPAGGWLWSLLWGPVAPVRLRLSWALPALALVVLGGATGTLAYVHLRAQSPPSAVPDTRLEQDLLPAGPKLRGSTKSNSLDEFLKPLPPKPVPAPVKRSATKKSSRKKDRSKVRSGQLATRKKPEPKVTAPAVKKKDNSDIIFGTTDMPGGGEVIIVRPPSRMGPLFKTKDFKKGGPYGSRK